MKIEFRADDSVHIEGYVNAVERDSNIINVPSVGRCVEQIRAGAFSDALSRAENVDILENHDVSRKLGGTSQGNLKLYEDSIGLRAIADITDAEIIEKARRGKIRGWSFGFVCTDSEIEQRAGNVPRRIVKALSLSEVSLIDGAYKPCYSGTLVEVRAEGGFTEYREGIDETVENAVEERAAEPDYSYYDALLRYFELRYNPYHDEKGRFCSGGGGGGGMLVVPKGQKGKGFYVGASDRDIAEQALATEYEEWKKVRQNVQGGQTAEESERIKNELVDSVNPKFVGLKREAVNGEGHWAWTKGRALSENEAQEMEINKVYDKGKYSVVSGGIGNEVVYFAADSSNPTIAKAKAIVAERKVKSMERFERDKKAGLETLYDRHTTGTTTTYDRWRSNNMKKFDEYWNGPQSNSRAEIDEDPDDPRVDYSYYDALLRYFELRYNPYHDEKGRFCSGGGSGGGVLVVPKGQKGKGFYVGASERDIAEQALANEFEEWVKSRNSVSDEIQAKVQKVRDMVRKSSAYGELEGDIQVSRDENGNYNLSYTQVKNYDRLKSATIGVGDIPARKETTHTTYVLDNKGRRINTIRKTETEYGKPTTASSDDWTGANANMGTSSSAKRKMSSAMKWADMQTGHRAEEDTDPDDPV